jgi:hypothetical protein
VVEFDNTIFATATTSSIVSMTTSNNNNNNNNNNTNNNKAPPHMTKSPMAFSGANNASLRRNNSRDNGMFAQVDEKQFILKSCSVKTFTTSSKRDELSRITLELHQGINIETGPLLCAALVTSEEQPNEQRLIIVVHHLVIDGVSQVWQTICSFISFNTHNCPYISTYLLRDHP